MAKNEEEEIMAEDFDEKSISFSGIFSTASEIVQSYGWCVVFLSIFLYVIWMKFGKKKYLDRQKEQQLIKAKKLDKSDYMIYQESIDRSRTKLQEKYNADTKIQQELLEKKRHQQAIEKIDEWEKQQLMTSYDARAFIESLIHSKKVVMFSKSRCSYSEKAKKALSVYRLSANVYTIVELDLRPDGDQIQDVLLEMTGRRSVPRVFINGECIGGGDETVLEHRSGKLDQRLKH